MKVSIDREACVTCGSCWDLCPDFFEQNPDDAFSQVKEKFRINGKPGQGTPPADIIACVSDAADLCPAQIIRVGES